MFFSRTKLFPSKRNTSPFNRKVTDPSRLMLPPDGNRYRCVWIEHGLTVHSDGNVTCGLDDPHGQRSFGNINSQSVEDIWANPEYKRLQRKMWDGHRCHDCGLAYQAGPEDESMPLRSAVPSTLVAETTVRCNLRCNQPACIPNNDPKLRTRDADFLSPESFSAVLDELAGYLHHVFFFNYGDPFVHKRAAQMLRHLRQTSPQAHVTTSTNGIPLSRVDRARAVVESGGLDHMIFTISGVTQESYSRYHVGGRLDLALLGMTNVLKARRELGLRRPVVNWRYLLFRWNDSEAEINAAVRLAEEYGVDEFTLYLTHIPPDGSSYRFSPGSPSFGRHRALIQNALGYTVASPAPDENGFYGLEQTDFGAARWMSWQARRRLKVFNQRAKLAVTTVRPEASRRTNHIFVLTPWEKLKVPLQPHAWKRIDISIPDHIHLDHVDVEIVSFDHWFPAEEFQSTDLRCLGALIREDGFDEFAVEPCQVVPLDTTDIVRLAGFHFTSPERLTDWAKS